VRAALAFLTPVGGARPPTPRALPWFPVVGALIGAGVGAVWWGAGELWPPLVAAVLAVVADLVLTGALHVDGLADTADGVLPHLERDRRLAVMAEPDVGAFGVAAVVGTLALRIAVLAALDPDVALLAGVWCASRTLMAVVPCVLTYARPGGIASAFVGASPALPIIIGAGLAVALGGIALEIRGVVAVFAVAVGGGAVIALAHRRLGGFTGDVLGAAGVVGETVGLLVASASW